MAEISLHIGHGKTGSSFLQSAFACNVRKLAQHGYIYPKTRSFALAQKGWVTSGNIDTTDDILKQVKKHRRQCQQEDKKLLFSSESLIGMINEDPEFLYKLVKAGHQVKVLLFTRCPLAFTQSYYNQLVKRSGYTKSMEACLSEINYSHPVMSRVMAVLKTFDELGIEASVYNYDNHKKQLLDCAAAFLSVDAEVLATTHKTVNRSLSPDEIVLARCFNKYFGAKSAKFIADPLCNLLPDIKTQPVLPASRELKKFIQNSNKAIQAFNDQYGDRYEKYKLLSADNIVGEELPKNVNLSQAQLDVIAKSASENLEPKKKHLLKRIVKKMQEK